MRAAECRPIAMMHWHAHKTILTDRVVFMAACGIACLFSEFAFMPRGVPHAWKSTGSKPGRVLFLYTFGTAGSLFEEAIPTNRPVALMSQQERSAAFQRHGSDTVGR